MANQILCKSCSSSIEAGKDILGSILNNRVILKKHCIMRWRYFFLVLFYSLPGLIVKAQNRPTNYVDRWNRIDTLIIRQGLTETALQQVNLIYQLAKKEKNDPQLIRSILYRMQLLETKTADAEKKNIRDLENEIKEAKEPSRSILNSILAEAYWNYFQQNRWKLYNRTTTEHYNKESIDSWDAEDFYQKIGQRWLASISDEKLLTQTSLLYFDPILIKGNVRYLRPTLYDLLVHRALAYFKNDEMDFPKTGNRFEISDPAAFADALAFARHRFQSADSLSLHFTALQLFQRLLLFHEKDPKPDAFLDLDIERIQFARIYSVSADKEEQYLSSLQGITNKYGNIPAASQAWYLQAQYHADLAAAYDPLKDTTHRYDYLEAKEICEKITVQKDSSEGGSNCQVLLKSILQKILSLKGEQVNIPGQPFRVLLSFRNIDHAYFRILRVDKKTKDDLGNKIWEEGYWKSLSEQKPIKFSEQALPDTKDHQLHRTEVRMDSLPAGEYALFASASQDFGLEKNPLAVQFFYVSAIAYINNGPDYFVLQRETGQPLARTDVQVWYPNYDNKQGRYTLRMGEQMITDNHGFFSISPSKTGGNNRFLLEFTRKQDHLFIDQESTYHSYYRDSEGAEAGEKSAYEQSNLHSFLFTDRSIYRPGQTLYFKGIVTTKDFETRGSKICPFFKTKIKIFDANHQQLDSMLVSTNEFGSYHGAFKLPENGLNGEFRLEDDSTNGSFSFSVEEYKRPRFFIVYDTLKGAHRLGDTVTCTGHAQAYAGNPIDGALVKFRIVRKVNFPYPWLFWRWGRPRYQETEIAHGETRTDQSGNFSVLFSALPDLSVQKAFDPVFEFRVSADVTDISGETRSAESSLPLGYKTLNLSIGLPAGNHVPADSLHSIVVNTENLSGLFEPAKINISMYRLAAPERLIRSRYWEAPDQFIMGKEQYLRDFPHDEYRDETNRETWTKKATVFEIEDTSKPNYTVHTDNYPLIPGWYLIEVMAKDKYGQVVKNIRYLELFDAKTGRPGSPEYNWTPVNLVLTEPGKIATSSIGSSANDLFLIRQSNRKPASNTIVQDSGVQYNFLVLGNEQKTIELPIQESDRGGFGLCYAFVKDNRFFTSIQTIAVPWSNKELQISYSSFRDKTIPGSGEKWKVRITGHKTEKLTSEVLAAMYDASLDQFKKQDWAIPDIYPEYYAQNNWYGSGNFFAGQSLGKFWNDFENPTYIKTYDQLINQQPTINRIRRMKLPMAQSVSANGIAATNRRVNPEAVVATEPTYARKDLVLTDSNSFSTGEKASPPGMEALQIRKNFNETAFFFPALQTDSSGNIEFSFTMPEAITQWKWMTLAHSKDLAFGYAEKRILSQKELMVEANAPRFLRDGDKLDFSAKIVNLTDSEITGQIQLQLIDPTTGQSVDGWFQNLEANQYFTAPSKQSTPVNFTIQIPFQYNKPLTYRLQASAAPASGPKDLTTLSDGEEGILPVVSNRVLITESLPLNLRGAGTKNFQFQKLLRSESSETLNHHALTVEFTANPAWYAVQALPTLMEYPNECSEQTFDCFYANALATKIANSSPHIKQILEAWRMESDSGGSLVGTLQKNPELKSVLLRETPWVLEGKNEAEQKRNIARLFEMGRMSLQIESNLQNLQSLQSAAGGFPWFKGGPEDRYISQYILTGIGHLKKLGALSSAALEKINAIVKPALAYLDKKIIEDFEAHNRKTPGSARPEEVGPMQIQYLYMRSYYNDNDIPEEAFPAINYYRKKIQTNWTKQNRYLQGMIALVLQRSQEGQIAKDIVNSLRQNAIKDPEQGMYWKSGEAAYYWYQAPVETQALLIEVFWEITKDNQAIDDMKTWLLKQKQASAWTSTKSTADACYALLLQGTDWLQNNPDVKIVLGDKTVNSGEDRSAAGSGYFKQIFEGPFVNPAMGNIRVTVSPTAAAKTSREPVWGAVYWQYFEDLDKIGNASASIGLTKKLFLEKNTSSGPVLEPVADNQALKPGDKLRVRMELHTDRNLEYVHLKDMRASCLEPVNVLSGYKWQGGLGYYETTKDLSTDFFFQWVPKGFYVFEYPLFVTQTGNFSNGIATIQCMYAPEFSGHSVGIRVNVENSHP
jgi:Bacterial Alpha-2-macroglobulin MG10 domain/Alpha-2-macroglobulin family/MG2 domain